MSESSLSLRRRRASRGRDDARPPQDRPAARAKGNGERAATRKGDGDKRRRAGDKRDRILRAAVKVFAQSGFHATRVSEVAKAAGVADGTIYLYFESKEELLFSLFEDRVSKLLSFMREELPKKPDAPARLRAIIDMQLGLLEGERDLAEVITVILRQSTRLMKEFAAPHFNAYLDAIAKIIAEGQATGAFRQDVSPHIAARAIFGALDGITLTWALGRAEQGALGRAAGQLADVLLRGLAP
ncbi:MAG: TetR/AcrR family transcriptional regulator [Labilithrix sp.]|nr:TetR/AcrR family transcriptional regulator [Labilithrix sp.]MBX3220698.1 TetR/AcrR family transcriptional regulator [Labilithrix sp.]